MIACKDYVASVSDFFGVNQDNASLPIYQSTVLFPCRLLVEHNNGF